MITWQHCSLLQIVPGFDPIKIAPQNQHFIVLGQRLNSGEHHTAMTIEERKALLDSCREGDLEAVWHLLEAGGDIHARDDEFSTCLHFASLEGNAALVRLLIERSACETM
jgi:ankyrin repeat protein